MNKGIENIFNEFFLEIQNQARLALIEGFKQGFEASEKQYQVKSQSNLLSRKEASKYLTISLPTLDKYVREGIIPSYRCGNTLRFKESELSEILLKRKF
jgi:excisionase family DNA binding protein